MSLNKPFLKMLMITGGALLASLVLGARAMAEVQFEEIAIERFRISGIDDADPSAEVTPENPTATFQLAPFAPVSVELVGPGSVIVDVPNNDYSGTPVGFLVEFVVPTQGNASLTPILLQTDLSFTWRILGEREAPANGGDNKSVYPGFESTRSRGARANAVGGEEILALSSTEFMANGVHRFQFFEMRPSPPDQDDDGVPDDADACSDTEAGALVDAKGCSIDQFCGAIDARRYRGRACKQADWQDDEPHTSYPRDCSVFQPSRYGRPICLPY